MGEIIIRIVPLKICFSNIIIITIPPPTPTSPLATTNLFPVCQKLSLFLLVCFLNPT